MKRYFRQCEMRMSNIEEKGRERDNRNKLRNGLFHIFCAHTLIIKMIKRLWSLTLSLSLAYTLVAVSSHLCTPPNESKLFFCFHNSSLSLFFLMADLLIKVIN